MLWLLGLGSCHAAATPTVQRYVGSDGIRVELRRIDLPHHLGLSDLSRAANGWLWTAPERQRRLIALDETAKVRRNLPLLGVPDGLDTEALTFLDANELLLGTESQQAGRRHDLLLQARLKADHAVVYGTITLPYHLWSLRAGDNHGIEGLCSAAGLVLASSEHVGIRDGRRFAPLGIYVASPGIRGAPRGRWHAAKLWLSSDTGRISALACRATGPAGGRPDDGSPTGTGIEVLAIERHFGVSRLLRVVIDRQRLPTDLHPQVIADLAKLLPHNPNLEGVTWTSNGDLALIVDGSWGQQQRDNQLVLLRHR